MDVETISPLVAQLAPIIGPRLACLFATAMVVVVVVAHGVMPWLPRPVGGSGLAYRIFYTALRIIAGNYAHAAPGPAKSGS